MRTSGHSEPCETQSGNDVKLRCALAAWFRRNKRDLPWRRTRDPYAVLISEIMLQQTTVATVIPYYQRWLRRFPTIRSLARATESDVLHAWQGLGYYSRARNLHRCAQLCASRFGGHLPANAAQLRSLPGIGRYTANAVAVFAFGQSLPLVEANTSRVLARLLNIRDSIDSTLGREKLWNASARLIPKSDARDFQSAMMDLGALVCTARWPLCHICSIKEFCAAPDPDSLPVRITRRGTISLVESHAWIRRQDKILLTQCQTRWRGMWMLPTIMPRQNAPIHELQFPFTHHQVALRVFPVRTRRRKPDENWFSVKQLKGIPIPSPHRRAIDAILEQPRNADAACVAVSTSPRMQIRMRA